MSAAIRNTVRPGKPIGSPPGRSGKLSILHGLTIAALLSAGLWALIIFAVRSLR
jgi:hypothetical protein